jgi:hypothetical protein
MGLLDLATGGISSAVAGGVQGILGIGQMVGGLFMPKPEIPDYQIPEEIYKNMTDAEYWSFQGLPEAQKQQFIEQSQRAGATALSQSASRKGGLGLVASVAQQEQDSATQLLSMDAQQRMQNLQNLYRAREVMAGQKGTQQEWKMNKVMYKRQKRDEMIGAGLQNIAGGLGSIAAGGDVTTTGSKPSYNFKPGVAPTLSSPASPSSLATGGGGIFSSLSAYQKATMGGPASSAFGQYIAGSR